MRSNNTNIFDSAIKSAVASIEMFQNRFDLVIDDLIQFYDSELQTIEYLSLTSSNPNNS